MTERPNTPAQPLPNPPAMAAESSTDDARRDAQLYELWTSHGVMSATASESDERPTYVVPMPPPNVTGYLHMGHASRCTVQDALVRFKRMLGYNALWQPGTDHAGIATQLVVERQLGAEGLSREKIGREAFVERVWQWKRKSGERIAEQQRQLGASADWSRSKFTLDEDMSQAVTHAFVRLFEEGLLYRDTRLINWCPECQTALSDLEVETDTGVEGELFSFAYKVADSAEELVVATTRPETLLGDTGVAVHPDDTRYRHLHGKFLLHPFSERRIPVVCDAILVDPEFGTGAVKLTPAHDFNDFAAGKRHGLPTICVLNNDGTMSENAGPYVGMSRTAARRAVVEKLHELGLARGTKKHRLNIPRCQRSSGVVEPMLSTQWFVKMIGMAELALDAVRTGQTEIHPNEWTKTYEHFLENIQDWCVSRQLWWGHRIPAWYGPNGEIRVAMERPAECDGWEQDGDVLDTWFSSALWPLTTQGWPNVESANFKKFYPASDLETAYDILFFWVARMMMFGLHFTGVAPFKRILLSGLVVDETGEKMSKMRGNVIDPLDLVHGKQLQDVAANPTLYNAYPSMAELAGQLPAFGPDAVRLTLASYPPTNRRIAFSLKRMQASRAFINKLRNASKLTLMLRGETLIPAGGWQPKNLYTRWMVSRLGRAAEEIFNHIDGFRLDEATKTAYSLIWNEYCDWFLEIAKVVLREPDHVDAADFRITLSLAFDTILRLMHPVIPFLTEDLWQCMAKQPACGPTLALCQYPRRHDYLDDEQAEQEFSVIRDVISAVRTVRAQQGVQPAAQTKIFLHTQSNSLRDRLMSHDRLICKLTRSINLEIATVDNADFNETSLNSVVSTPHGLVHVQVTPEEKVDLAKERERIERELVKVEKTLAQIDKRLSFPLFARRAPSEVVAAARNDAQRLRDLRGELKKAYLATAKD